MSTVVITSPLLASRYRTSHAGKCHTHAFRVRNGRVLYSLCRKIRATSACDSSMWTTDRPTCPDCARKWERHHMPSAPAPDTRTERRDQRSVGRPIARVMYEAQTDRFGRSIRCIKCIIFKDGAGISFQPIELADGSVGIAASHHRRGYYSVD